MKKFAILGIVTITIMYLQLAAFAEQDIQAGPYKVSMDLPGFDAINVVGPLKSSTDTNVVTSYLVGVSEGNNSTVDEWTATVMIEIAKSNLPINTENKEKLNEAYSASAQAAFPNVYWSKTDNVMIDGHYAGHAEYIFINFICFFLNNNERVSIGTRNLDTKEYNQLLRTFHVSKGTE